MKTLIDNGLIMSAEGKLTAGGIIMEGGTITRAGSGVSRETEDYDEHIDGKGRWFLPGFVNTHGHAGSTLLRGAGEELPLRQWLEQVMWPNEQKLDRDMVSAAQDLALAEMLRSGTTAFLDMYHLGIHDLAEKTSASGMRAVLGRGMIGFGGEAGWQERLDASADFIDSWHEAAEGRIRTAVMPHAPYTCPPAFMEKAASLAVEKGVLFHTHCAETRQECRDHRREHGLHPVDHLHQLGIFQLDVLLAHAVHITEAHMQILADTGTGVSHNPSSNAKLGSGTAPIPEMMKAGVRTALGTDSTASNNTLDMVEEMRLAALIHKGRLEDPEALPAADVFRMATSGGSELLGFHQTGVIQAGMEADFIAVNPHSLHLTPNLDRAAAHTAYSLKSSDVEDVWVQGRRLMKNKELVTLDEERIRFNADKQAAKLL
ncbi:amidohydrolase [Alkalicoccus urumqiensis]|uniref:5-methylthioadenosine/S-adenosylhomocysteine deaminase n=1 Tax=Alkalicoccus urumqiensis TaxID=1548213 RepID=A0A2P6MKM9_ALKUR|nr:amidohydrolase [Alkalicoccus urumqiensis]PRO66844.1 N-ethylammeline chlorohydrolase [Alkalicoccus urumqiensis]